MAEQPAPPFLLHFHAAVYVIWLVLVSVQIFLVETGDIKRHKTLGMGHGSPFGVHGSTGIGSGARGSSKTVGTPSYAPQFLSLEFEGMFVFSVFIIAGLLWRRNLSAHKRLMILSAVAISDAGFARLWIMGFKVTVPGLFGWWLQYFWGIALLLIAMAAWDLWRRRRIHPAVLAGAALLWTRAWVATTLNFSLTWKVMMITLVNAWDFRG